MSNPASRGQCPPAACVGRRTGGFPKGVRPLARKANSAVLRNVGHKTRRYRLRRSLTLPTCSYTCNLAIWAVFTNDDLVGEGSPGRALGRGIERAHPATGASIVGSFDALSHATLPGFHLPSGKPGHLEMPSHINEIIRATPLGYQVAKMANVATLMLLSRSRRRFFRPLAEYV